MFITMMKMKRKITTPAFSCEVFRKYQIILCIAKIQHGNPVLRKLEYIKKDLKNDIFLAIIKLHKPKYD
jgi:hypothetical protein